MNIYHPEGGIAVSTFLGTYPLPTLGGGGTGSIKLVNNYFFLLAIKIDTFYHCCTERSCGQYASIYVFVSVYVFECVVTSNFSSPMRSLRWMRSPKPILAAAGK